jgi:hypothetical protein
MWLVQWQLFAVSCQPCFACGIQCSIGSGEVTNFDHISLNVGQVVVDESSNLGLFSHDVGIAVDEEGASQGVATVFSAFSGGCNHVQANSVQGFSIFLVVSETEEANSVGATRDALERERCRLRSIGCC